MWWDIQLYENNDCRKRADKCVIAIDGQYSTLLSILYQTKHGDRLDRSVVDDTEHLHAVLSVQCKDTVLLVKPVPKEAHPHTELALIEGVGGTEGCREVLSKFRQPLSSLDYPSLYRKFPKLKCVSKDPLHIALKIEQATGEKVSRCSLAVRRCLLKFRQGMRTTLPYHRKDRNTGDASQLSDTLNAMTHRKWQFYGLSLS